MMSKLELARILCRFDMVIGGVLLIPAFWMIPDEPQQTVMIFVIGGGGMFLLLLGCALYPTQEKSKNG